MFFIVGPHFLPCQLRESHVADLRLQSAGQHDARRVQRPVPHLQAPPPACCEAFIMEASMLQKSRRSSCTCSALAPCTSQHPYMTPQRSMDHAA